MIQHIKKLFLVMIALTCFTCFQRADYNLPLFAFSFFLWQYKHPNVQSLLTQVQKIRLFYLYVATWLVDFIWLIYWGVTWSSNDYQNNGSSGTSSFVLTLSIFAFIVKVFIVFYSSQSSSFCIFSNNNANPLSKISSRI